MNPLLSVIEASGRLPDMVAAQIVWAILWLVYRLTMHRSGHFGQNRVVLLAMAAASLFIPLLSIPLYPARQAISLPVFTVGEVAVEMLPDAKGLDYAALFGWAYLAGIVALAGVSLWQLGRLRGIVRSSGEPVEVEGCKIFDSRRVQGAMAFGRRIIVNRCSLSATELPQVIAHEQAHVKLGHNYDLLLAQTMVILCWWNPFVWLWRRSLREIHEYQADRYVLDRGYDTAEYVNLMIKTLTGIHPEFASGFSYSLTKKRLVMISRMKKGSPCASCS